MTQYEKLLQLEIDTLYSEFNTMKADLTTYQIELTKHTLYHPKCKYCVERQGAATDRMLYWASFKFRVRRWFTRLA